ncbi:hypothetical protein JQU17_00420 [Ponticoccus sp. SC2-23]|uniref:ATP/GTP-binding protein n=1 Tax=Alexandriicola marinus TaxID=2081710 RepID=UPI000FD7D7C9|nr:ATP/GTP-binding protein [Alexandriicola marinus]MBM1218642.1 hypothetical protein [Ponticoccus sp. SC6-9]MBM1224286.1 hypothetical protein [Ponticoccus sp. SC6-15]MBM1229935.1 hypothetical protein [Ponticoccus sp. SC6-38]MBM1233252.1 hypothetical protein [Ponticoccus sp. SC6-45]MBM1236798.1 hypothetical protein [Ponticoccus sp. SC6-49]MBM1242263.1 hypothetical protein [Ponticoccus sp. SC2-64]MBM1246776.1 hypothetical protein [Ponticoccus sp. SC6-42]MBM1251254.1 hypothetical protein [Pont
MRNILLAVSVILPASGMAEGFQETWRLGGFTMPESAWYEASIDRIIVSNIGVFGPDGGMDGRLSLVSSDGVLEEADWVTGLMDPKGMSSHDGLLYVADAMGMHIVSIADGALMSTITLEGATFPNDVTVSADGSVFVTDFLAGGLYRYQDGAAEVFVPAGSLPLPNGILADQGVLWIGSFGDQMQPDFTVAEPGGLWQVDIDSRAISPVETAQGVGSVDGMVIVGEAVIFDDNPSGTMFIHDAAGTRELASVGAGAADLGVMGDTVIVPNLGSGEIVAYRYTTN